MIRAIVHIGFNNGSSGIKASYRIFAKNGDLIHTASGDGHPAIDPVDISARANAESWKRALKAAFVRHVAEQIDGLVIPEEGRLSLHDPIVITDFDVI